jgi:hypothetical protein
MYNHSGGFYKTLIIFLASLYLVTTTFEVYIPLIKPDVGLWQMLFLNIAFGNSFSGFPGLFRGEPLSYSEGTEIQKYTFIVQTLVILHYFLFLIGYVFFSIERIGIFDIVVLLLVQSILYRDGIARIF